MSGTTPNRPAKKRANSANKDVSSINNLIDETENDIDDTMTLADMGLLEEEPQDAHQLAVIEREILDEESE